jgi:mRNA interferase YafQ
MIKKFVKVYWLILDQSLENQIRLKNLKDHELSGGYEGFRELHVQHNWLIIYRVDHRVQEIFFARTGTHADLFR